MAEPRSPRAPAALLVLLLFCTYGYFIGAPSWNENSRFDLTRSLVERGRLDIDPYAFNTGDRSTRGGHIYSDKAPGASLLAVPVYAGYLLFLRAVGGDPPQAIEAAGRTGPGTVEEEGAYLINPSHRRAMHLCNLSTNALAGALLGGLFFLTLCSRWGVNGRAAFAATLALGAGSMVLPYATMFYGHVLAGFFLFAAFVSIEGTGAAATSRAGRLVGAGALAGAAVLTELPSAGAVLLLAGLVAWRGWPGARGVARALGWFALGVTGPVLVLLVYQQAAFGSLWRPGYALVSRPEFAEGMARGVMGVGLPRPGVLLAMLVGRARGLFYLAPVLLLAAWGLGRWLRASWPDRARRGAVLLALAVVLFFVLMNAGYYMWYGGSAIGPRHLIPALPFLCLGLPFALRRPRPWLVAPLLVVSIVNHLAATAVGAAAPLVTDVLRDHVYPLLLRGQVPSLPGASNVGRLLGLPGVASLLPLLVLWGLALPTLIPLLPASPDRPNITNHPGSEQRAAPQGP